MFDIKKFLIGKYAKLNEIEQENQRQNIYNYLDDFVNGSVVKVKCITYRQNRFSEEVFQEWNVKGILDYSDYVLQIVKNGDIWRRSDFCHLLYDIMDIDMEILRD